MEIIVEGRLLIKSVLSDYEDLSTIERDGKTLEGHWVTMHGTRTFIALDGQVQTGVLKDSYLMGDSKTIHERSVKAKAREAEEKKNAKRVNDGMDSILAGQSRAITVSKATAREAKRIQELYSTANVFHYNHMIGSTKVEHSFERHGEGKEKNSNQKPVTPEDMKQIFNIINHYDKIVAGTKTDAGDDTVLYYKHITSGADAGYTLVYAAAILPKGGGAHKDEETGKMVGGRPVGLLKGETLWKRKTSTLRKSLHMLPFRLCKKVNDYIDRLLMKEAQPDDKGIWRTIHGSHVYIEDGEITKGPSQMVGKNPDHIEGASPKSTPKPVEDTTKPNEPKAVKDKAPKKAKATPPRRKALSYKEVKAAGGLESWAGPIPGYEDGMTEKDTDSSTVKAKVVKDLSHRLKKNADFVKSAEDYIKRLESERVKHVKKFPEFPNWGNTRYADPVQNLVDHYVGLWASTSGDHNPEAQTMQQAVKEELDVKNATLEHFAKLSEDDSDSDIGAMKSFVRAMYDNTQSFLKEKGIDTVNLYRGVILDERPEDFPELIDKRASGQFPCVTQPASSFSLNPKVALEFAGADDEDADYYEEDTLYRFIITASVPREQILSTWMTGIGCRDESEMVVLGNKDNYAGYAFSMSNSDDDDGKQHHPTSVYKGLAQATGGK